ncbi:MAG: hypothetical protein HY721_18335 [Planctomycetes bacterium]|nr:hypothetical protein [Planctomycetota bacterium]
MWRILGCLFLCAAPIAGQVPFLRGDANDDGRRSIADAHYISLWLHGGGPQPPCVKAADVNDDSLIRTSGNINDVLAIVMSISCGDLEHGAGCWSHPSVAEPRDAPGEDPTPDDLPCDSYTGKAQPVADPEARLEILEATCPGGENALAVLKLRMSHSRPIGGYWGAFDGLGLFAEALQTMDVDGRTQGGDPEYAVVQGGQVFFAHLESASGAGKVLPGSDLIALKIYLRLEPGTPAGVHPIVLLEGEMADSLTGQATFPSLVDGVLTVEEDVAAGAAPELNSRGAGFCSGLETLPPSGPEDVQVAFHMGLVPGKRGSPVTVPLWIEANVPIEGFSFAFTYKREALRLVRVTPRPREGRPWGVFRYDATHRSDPKQPLDDVWGEAVFSGADPAGFLPPRELHHVLDFDFEVDPMAPDGMVYLRLTSFRTDPELPDRVDWKTALRAYGQWLESRWITCFQIPRFDDSGVVIGESTTAFLRGDANADGVLSLADAVLAADSTRRIPCEDAGDADDSGSRNFGDAVRIFRHLFEGPSESNAIPPPFPDLGLDETLDPTQCREYRVSPAAATPDTVRVGPLEVGAGEIVHVPIYVTTSSRLAAYQLLLRHDPELFRLAADQVRIQGTAFEPVAGDVGFNYIATSLTGLVPGHIAVAFAADLFSSSSLPPGSEVLVGKIPGLVSDALSPGDEVLLEPVAFPEGEDPRPDRLRTELVEVQDGRLVALLPALEAGVLRVVDPGEPTFLRGDANFDLKVDISDAVFTLSYLFLGGAAPSCEDSADADDTGKLELTDAVFTLSFLFGGPARALPPPYPERGRDGRPDDLAPCREAER